MARKVKPLEMINYIAVGYLHETLILCSFASRNIPRIFFNGPTPSRVKVGRKKYA